MKLLLRFLYVIFYTLMSILYLVMLFGEVLLIFPIGFLNYIFTGKNYFHQDYDNMFFVKMNHKFEKIMDKMDPDYEKPESKIDHYTDALYKCIYAELYGVLENEKTFEGAINRWKEKGSKVYHITPLFCDMIKKLRK